MSKGFSLPLVLAFLVVFLSVPVFYFVYISKDIENLDVKGARVESSLEEGLLIKITSKGGTWDLNEYLCKSKNECLESLESGKKWGVVSGGLTEDHEIKVDPENDWEDYRYMKLFVKSGWGSIQRTFDGNMLAGAGRVVFEQITEDQKEYDVVIVPIPEIITESSILIEFSD